MTYSWCRIWPACLLCAQGLVSAGTKTRADRMLTRRNLVVVPCAVHQNRPTREFDFARKQGLWVINGESKPAALVELTAVPLLLFSKPCYAHAACGRQRWSRLVSIVCHDAMWRVLLCRRDLGHCNNCRYADGCTAEHNPYKPFKAPSWPATGRGSPTSKTDQ